MTDTVDSTADASGDSTLPPQVENLLDKLEDQAERDWYAAAAAEHGWSRNVLLSHHQ